MTSAAWSQSEIWRPLPSDTAPQAASTRPSPLTTWQDTLPLRRGIGLWARNSTGDSVVVVSVEVWDCINIGAGCGRTLLDTVVPPGDSLQLLTIRPRQWNAKYRFRWTHYWVPADSTETAPPPLYVLPAWAIPAIERASFVENYEEADYLVPRSLEVDLDGDGTRDVALLIRDRAGRAGIALLRQGAAVEMVVVGAGRRFGPRGDDFGSLESWSIAPQAEGDGRGALLLAWRGHSAGRILWTPQGYRWNEDNQ